eukprot:TRINITY_DN29844_c0_g1_i2.p1 TRINITY_DN29844_c0_g1~~TRINITY_DN29844_c0_g1_i2.p1  ORF type:complete len:458 (-),score=46.12 TRINITY_DN29844_c0_g1_i2:713-1975(-)
MPGQHDVVETTYNERRRSVMLPITMLTSVQTGHLVLQVKWYQLQSDDEFHQLQIVPAFTLLHATCWLLMMSGCVLLCWMHCFRDTEKARFYVEKAVWLVLVEALSDGARSAVEVTTIQFLVVKYVVKASGVAVVLSFLLPLPCLPLGCYIPAACSAYAAARMLVGDHVFVGLIEGETRTAAVWLDWDSMCLSGAYMFLTFLYRMASCLRMRIRPEGVSPGVSPDDFTRIVSPLDPVVPGPLWQDFECVEIGSPRTPRAQEFGRRQEKDAWKGCEALREKVARSPSQEYCGAMDPETHSTCTVLSNDAESSCPDWTTLDQSANTSFATWRFVQSRSLDGQWRKVSCDDSAQPLSVKTMQICGARVAMDTETTPRTRLQVSAGQVELEGQRMVRVGSRLLLFGDEGVVSIFVRQVTDEGDGR